MGLILIFFKFDIRVVNDLNNKITKTLNLTIPSSGLKRKKTKTKNIC